jgi:hypothetical protein
MDELLCEGETMETGCDGIGDECDHRPPRFHPAWKYHFDVARMWHAPATDKARCVETAFPPANDGRAFARSRVVR